MHILDDEGPKGDGQSTANDEIGSLALEDVVGEDAEFAELLRHVDPRPAVPLDVMSRARAAAEDEWERSLQQRSLQQHSLLQRRRRRWGALGLALAACLGWLILGTDVEAWKSFWQRGGAGVATPTQGIDRAPLARLEVSLGEVGWSTAEGGEVRLLQAGDILADSGWLSTDAESRGALRLAAGQSLRLDVDTRLKLLSADILELEGGAVYIDSASEASLEVRTPLGIARDIGTQFEVRLRPEGVRLRVREGKVQFESDGGRLQADPGVELKLSELGAAERGRIDVFGEAWDWSLDVAPRFELEGSTLDAFLAWVTRESGWRLQYAQSALEAETTSIVLHGSLESVPVSEATGMVLATCGLEHTVNDGVLVVRRP